LPTSRSAANDYGPTRKLSRGLANVVWGWTELIHQSCRHQRARREFRRVDLRAGEGRGPLLLPHGRRGLEIASFPFATNKGTYKQPYRDNVPWIHGGYDEFPPELGFESRYRYTREYHGW